MKLKRLVITSRESRLAMWQAEHVRRRLSEFHPDCDVGIFGMTTRGDRILDRPRAASRCVFRCSKSRRRKTSALCRGAADRLDDFSLAIFVSPNAVEHGLPHLLVRRPWPLRLQAAAIGQGTAARLAALPVFVPHARIAEAAAALGLTRIVASAPADAGILAGLCAYDWSAGVKPPAA